jgi:hypothetical protein
MKVYQKLAQVVVAIENCRVSSNHEWKLKHSDTLKKICEKYLPSGSGFDNGCTVDDSLSNENRLHITVAFHAMDEMGGYDGWYGYKVYVTPNLCFGFNLRVVGQDYRHQLKEYIEDTLEVCLNAEYEEK